jgi:5-methylcytosine-specific restriction endonuclease McrA
LTVRAKTINPPGYKYGDYRVWGDLRRSAYFRVRPEESGDEAFDVLRRLPLVNGSFAKASRITLAQACQTMRGVTGEGNALLEAFSTNLVLEERAMQVVDEYELERDLAEGEAVAELLRREHRGASPERVQHLIASARRNRQLAKEVHDLYEGRCQLCAFDSPLVYGVPSAESHHLVYLSRGGEDVQENLVLACPNHHTVIHKTDATFDYGCLRFLFPNGRTEPLCLNRHLKPGGKPPPPFERPPEPAATLANPKEAARFIEAIRANLTPDLLTSQWAAERKPGSHPLTGYCYVASEALYHLLGGSKSDWMVFRCTFSPGKTHWWLADAAGQILDPTAEQFGGEPPHRKGQRTQFLSRQPSRRATELMRRVAANLR